MVGLKLYQYQQLYQYQIGAIPTLQFFLNITIFNNLIGEIIEGVRQESAKPLFWEINLTLCKSVAYCCKL